MYVSLICVSSSLIQTNMKVIPSNYKVYKDEDFPTLKNDLILQAANGNLNQQNFSLTLY